MMAAAAAIGVVSGILGLYLSYYASVSSGAAIVLVAVGIFLAALLGTTGRLRQVLGNARRGA
jgi:manganese/iron transport system permease protein